MLASTQVSMRSESGQVRYYGVCATKQPTVQPPLIRIEAWMIYTVHIQSESLVMKSLNNKENGNFFYI
ncbi:hypothetical protein M8J76_001032 [Diaphorina citri]|nr:hypothetical protein M8J76_001032 [Diaphorina citri]